MWAPVTHCSDRQGCPVRLYERGGKRGPCQASEWAATPGLGSWWITRAREAERSIRSSRGHDEHRSTASVERSRVLGPSPAAAAARRELRPSPRQPRLAGAWKCRSGERLQDERF